MRETANPVLASISNCIECGCDDYHACSDEESDSPCHWVRLDRTVGLGVCSACPDAVARWDLGDRTISVPINAEPGGFSIWTIYDKPKDYPDKYVARKWINNRPTSEVLSSDSLEGLRDLLPAGLTCMTRHPTDDPAIVETWL